MSAAPSFSVYVHIPFCAQKCPYCDFNTYAVARAPEEEYVQAVCRELESYRDRAGFAGRSVRSVFFGGGTPSILSGESIGRIVNAIDRLFPLEAGAEVTLEANPNHGTLGRLQGVKAAGVNRISFGVQSFNSEYLKLLGRDHSSEDAKNAVHAAIRAGIKNVSVDLIFGVPSQSLKDLEADVLAATELPIRHISTYSLTIEPGTPFFQRQERGLLKAAPESVVSEMLEKLPELLEVKGFARYEISNFARNGSESVHNQVYWTGGDYVGVGAGAHSYQAEYTDSKIIESATRWSTLALPSSYIDGVSKGACVSWREKLDVKALMFEFFYLGLRRVVGVTQKEFSGRFGCDLPSHYRDVIAELQSEGFLECSGDTIRLSKNGISVADSVFERFAG